MKSPQHKIIELEGRGTHLSGEEGPVRLILDSSFDSGNIGEASWDPETQSVVFYGEPDTSITGKQLKYTSWFHFRVMSEPRMAKINFSAHNMRLLWSLAVHKWQQFRPAIKIGEQKWKKLEKPATLKVGKNREIVADFEIDTRDLEEREWLQLSTCFPYSYEECQDDLDEIENTLSISKHIYFERECLALSYEKRRIELLTITSHKGKINQREPFRHTALFPHNKGTSKATRFKGEKQIVLISGRVHPGETPASHALLGLLKNLVDPKCPLASILLNHFVFKIVPMINTDGVYRGHFRTDCLGQDLNRYYEDPSIELQSPVMAVKELLMHFGGSQRLCCFIDFHAHGLRRNCYFYGNRSSYLHQVEMLTFAKLMEANCPDFKFKDCDFTAKSMGTPASKANNPKQSLKRTKMGCARVVAGREAALLHSFTLELGYHGPVLNSIKQSQEEGSDEEPPEDLESLAQIEKQVKTIPTSSDYFTIQTFQNVGRSVLHALLDLYSLHPSSILPLSEAGSIGQIRQELAQSIKKDYIREEKNLGLKEKNIHQFIDEIYQIRNKKRVDKEQGEPVSAPSSFQSTQIVFQPPKRQISLNMQKNFRVTKQTPRATSKVLDPKIEPIKKARSAISLCFNQDRPQSRKPPPTFQVFQNQRSTSQTLQDLDSEPSRKKVNQIDLLQSQINFPELPSEVPSMRNEYNFGKMVRSPTTPKKKFQPFHHTWQLKSSQLLCAQQIKPKAVKLERIPSIEESFRVKNSFGRDSKDPKDFHKEKKELENIRQILKDHESSLFFPKDKVQPEDNPSNLSQEITAAKLSQRFSKRVFGVRGDSLISKGPTTFNTNIG